MFAWCFFSYDWVGQICAGAPHAKRKTFLGKRNLLLELVIKHFILDEDKHFYSRDNNISNMRVSFVNKKMKQQQEEEEEEAVEVPEEEVALEDAQAGDEEPSDGIDLSRATSSSSSSSDSSSSDGSFQEENEEEEEKEASPKKLQLHSFWISRQATSNASEASTP